MKERTETINKLLSERGADFRIEYQTVWKNNEAREGYVLRSDDPEKNACPVMYRGDWIDGKTDEDACDWLCAAYSQYAMAVDTQAITCCDNILERILPRVVSADNADGLARADICCREVAGGELLASYYLPITLANGKDASVPVTRTLLSLAGISPEEAHEAALKNMSATIDVVPMEEMLAEIIGVPAGEKPDGIPELLVVTNRQRIYGAAAILIPELFNALIEMFGNGGQKVMEKDLIVLPSSIHEVLVTEIHSAEDIPRFKAMVREVNDTEVSPEDRLSYSVFGWRNGRICAVA